MIPATVSAALAPHLEGADHVDVKSVSAPLSLRAFIAEMIAYQPGWITALYHVRRQFVRLLGMRQAEIPRPPTYTPADLPCAPGDNVAFFKVIAFEEGRLWAAAADDTHLRAILGVVAEVEPGGAGDTTFHVVTIVFYKNWAGPVYFNVIRPFHHLVVGSMVRAGARAKVAGPHA